MLGVALLVGCPQEDGESVAVQTTEVVISVDAGVVLYGEEKTGSALATADLDADGADELLFFEQRYSDTVGTGAAVGVLRGLPTAPTDLSLQAVYRAYATKEASIFGYPFAPLGDGSLLVADWAVQCDGDGAVWILDGPFVTTAWQSACATQPGWERVAAPPEVVGYGNAVAAVPGGYAVGAPTSATVFVTGAAPETRTGPPGFGTSLLAADLDGDGVAELIVGAPDAGVVDAGAELIGGPGFGTALVAGDLDGDGRSDLVVGERPDPGDPAGAWWLYPGPPVDGAALRIAESGWVYPIGPVADVPGDLDGDGHAEFMASAPGADDAVQICYGPFPASRSVRVTGPGGATRSGLGRAMTHGDLDGDGRLELVLAAPIEAGLGRPGLFVLGALPVP